MVYLVPERRWVNFEKRHEALFRRSVGVVDRRRVEITS